MKIGLFLGTFDPIHIGHIADIIKVLDPANGYNIDRVYIVPAYQNPWKENKASNFDLRYALCKAAADKINNEMLKYDKGYDLVAVSNAESLVHSESHYSYLVLEKLKEMLPDDELVIIGGTDVAQEIQNWKHGDWIIENFSVIAIKRKGYVSPYDPEIGIEISSSDIRAMVKNGKCPLPYVPYEVWEKIKLYNLYV